MSTEAGAPPSPPRQPTAVRPAITQLVPNDPLYRVRLIAVSVFAVLYVLRLWTEGIIADRISVGVSVGLFLLCAFAGKPWRRWGLLVVDALLYAAMWFSYEVTRGSADRGWFTLQKAALRDMDRAMFLGYDPNVWIQRSFYHDDIRWYDNLASCVYYTHFIVPVIALAVVWAVSRVQWVRFMKRFATLLGVACVMFILLPSAPPWMAADPRFGSPVIAPIIRSTHRGFLDLGFKAFVNDWHNALDWSNPVAAMPSLHAAFALFVPAFFLPMIRHKWLKALVLVFPVMMLAALVYLGEHWVIDGLIGWALVGAVFAIWDGLERRQRTTRATRARRAVSTTSP